MNCLDIASLKNENFNEVKVFKNIVNFKDSFNFNDILSLISYRYFKNTIKYPYQTGMDVNDIFSHNFQIFNLRENVKLKEIHRQLSILFKKDVQDEKFLPDIFFSFRASTGNMHVDNENVFIIGLEGKTFYDFPSLNKIYEINKTDAIFIPAKMAHAALSIHKRIVCSWSIFK